MLIFVKKKKSLGEIFSHSQFVFWQVNSSLNPCRHCYPKSLSLSVLNFLCLGQIVNQDSAIPELEMERDKLSRELQSAEARLKLQEKSVQGLTEENDALKRNYLVLAEARDKEQSRSAELSAELLALAQSQDALRRQLEEQQQSVRTTTQGFHGELDRVRALISRMPCDRVKVKQCVGCFKSGTLINLFT